MRTGVDVAVVGGGPAGALAAWVLARGGAKVTVLERCPLPRYKTCGGAVVRRAACRLPFPIAPVVCRPFAAARVRFLASGLVLTGSSASSDAGPGLETGSGAGTPLISMTMRASLDAFLLEQASRAGAAVLDGCEARGLQQSARGISIDVKGGRIEASFVVGADGARGLVGRWAGMTDERLLLPAIEAELEPHGDPARMEPGDASFDFDVVPEGYGWIFPKDAHLSVGVLDAGLLAWPRMGARQRPGGLRRAYARYIELLRDTGGLRIAREERHGYVIPVGGDEERLARGRVLLTGDSAGLADPVTGEGITAAIASGQMAATAILGGAPDPARVERSYRRAVREAILEDLRAARVLARLLYGTPATVRNALARRRGERLTRVLVQVFSGERDWAGVLSHASAALSPLVRGQGRGRPTGAPRRSGRPPEPGGDRPGCHGKED